MHGSMGYSHVIWDWNGTLLDDVGWCMEVMNRMLASRSMKPIGSISEYRNAFCFPVINYYKNIGFSFESESFEILANEYVSSYRLWNGKCRLHDNAGSALSAIKAKGISQIILSASEINDLLAQLSEYEVTDYFDEVIGLNDIYAKSKLDLGKDYISRNSIRNALMVGDTEHDFEVARALKIDCVLVANGHQGKDKLQLCNVPVLDNLSQVAEYISRYPL